LRHSGAITVATDKIWSSVSDEKGPLVMGHDLSAQIKHYQRWIK
tara:strand:+ start:147 stop:278 length:132 start_codon:yes stop_codon:yes gene_type:complete